MLNMNCIRKDTYCNKPFTEEMSQADFFTHYNIQDLITKCEENKENIVKFRTIGIIESIGGNFFVKDLNSVGNADIQSILVNMAYINRPLQNNILPYTAQILGTIQWKSRPVIYASLIQVLTTANALRISNAIATFTTNHVANR